MPQSKGSSPKPLAIQFVTAGRAKRHSNDDAPPLSRIQGALASFGFRSVS